MSSCIHKNLKGRLFNNLSFLWIVTVSACKTDKLTISDSCFVLIFAHNATLGPLYMHKVKVMVQVLFELNLARLNFQVQRKL